MAKPNLITAIAGLPRKGAALQQVEDELAAEAERQQAEGKLPPDVLAQTAPVQTDGGSPFAVAGSPPKSGFSIHLQPELRSLTVESDGIAVHSALELVGGKIKGTFTF